MIALLAKVQRKRLAGINKQRATRILKVTGTHLQQCTSFCTPDEKCADTDTSSQPPLYLGCLPSKHKEGRQETLCPARHPATWPNWVTVGASCNRAAKVCFASMVWSRKLLGKQCLHAQRFFHALSQTQSRSRPVRTEIDRLRQRLFREASSRTSPGSRDAVIGSQPGKRETEREREGDGLERVLLLLRRAT